MALKSDYPLRTPLLLKGLRGTDSNGTRLRNSKILHI